MICDHLNGSEMSTPAAIDEERRREMRVHFRLAMAHMVHHNYTTAFDELDKAIKFATDKNLTELQETKRQWQQLAGPK